eukprot:scaffold103497_cov23-Tisochrysis_lutea.AAC.1
MQHAAPAGTDAGSVAGRGPFFCHCEWSRRRGRTIFYHVGMQLYRAIPELSRAITHLSVWTGLSSGLRTPRGPGRMCSSNEVTLDALGGQRSKR